MGPWLQAALTTCVLMCCWACGADNSAPGVRGQCATATGDPLCPDETIETPEEACWKLVTCGSIPIDNATDQPSCFDYPRCIRHIERFSAHRLAVGLACVAASACDELRFSGSPDCPSNNESQMPPCLSYGSQ